MALVAPMAELEARMHAVASERLANVVVAREEGRADFTARLATRDRDAFDVAITATHTLRYLDQVPALGKGEALAIGGVNYRVIEPPRRLNPCEMTAELVSL